MMDMFDCPATKEGDLRYIDMMDMFDCPATKKGRI